MPQVITCDSPGCGSDARWMVSDMTTGKTEAFCKSHYSRPADPAAAAPESAPACSTCGTPASITMRDSESGTTEAFCHPHFAEFVLSLAARQVEAMQAADPSIGAVPQEATPPQANGVVDPQTLTEHVVHRGESAGSRAAHAKARQRKQDKQAAEQAAEADPN